MRTTNTMRKLFTPFFALVMLTLFSSASTAQPIFNIRKGHVGINTRFVTPNWVLSSFSYQMGKADRFFDGYNKTHIYDQQGIVVFEEKRENRPSGKVLEFQLYLSAPAEANDVTPKGVFTGQFKVDKLKLSSKLTATTVQKSLKNWTKSNSYLKDAFRYARMGTYVYFEFDPTHTRLIKVSIGPDKKQENE
jgi:hypothetical protein